MPIQSEHFDGVTSPSLPSGWSFGGGYATTSTLSGGLSAPSSPNVLTTNGTSTFILGTYGTQDSNSGGVSVQATVAATTLGSHRCRGGVLWRGSSSTLNTTSTTWYGAWVDWNLGQLSFSKSVSGTQSLIAAVASTSLANDAFYTLLVTHDTSGNVNISLQRVSDGHWLNSSGTFQSGSATAISTTDSSITGSGYAGVYGADDTGSVYTDDWIFDNYTPVASYTASMAATEGHDAAAIAGTAVVGTMSPTDGHDAASIAANTLSVILTVQDGADTPTLAGNFASVASAAVAESHDAGSIFATQRAGLIAVTDGHDTPSISGKFSSVAAASIAEHHDTPSIVADVQNAVVLRATEGADSPSLSGSFAHVARMSPAEGGDVGSIAGRIGVSFALAAQEAGDRGAIAGFALGPPPAITAREAGDIAAFFGGTATIRYNVYDSGPIDSPVDYTHPIADTADTTWTSPFTLSPGTWRFAVRAENDNGEEQNVDCLVTVAIDAYGNDVSNRPLPPKGLRAIPLPGGAIRVEWTGVFGGPPGRAATRYNVYATAAPLPSFGTVAATVDAASGLFGMYSYTLAGGRDETRYAISVRAANAFGEEDNVNFVVVVAEAEGPSRPVFNLTGTAVV